MLAVYTREAAMSDTDQAVRDLQELETLMAGQAPAAVPPESGLQEHAADPAPAAGQPASDLQKPQAGPVQAEKQAVSDLKERVADSVPAGYAVRVVRLTENKRKAALLAAGVVVLLGIAGWLGWRWQQHKAPVPKAAVQAPARIVAAQAEPPKQPAPAQQAAATVPVDAQKEATPQKAEALVPGLKHAPDLPQGPAVMRDQPAEQQAVQKQHKDKAEAAPAYAEEKKRRHAAHKPAVAAGSAHSQAEAPGQAAPVAEAKQQAAAPAPAPVSAGRLDKRTRQLNMQQQADNEFRKANGLMQQGHINEALAGYEAALKLDASHDAARQAMVVLLLEHKRNADAERVLQEGLKNNLRHSGFAMVLARVQIEREAPWSALLTLQKTLPYASQQAEYQAFIAALLQRLKRHKEAVAYYQKALQLAPNSGVWLMGMGISLQALQRREEARDAFKRAIETNALNADLQEFVTQRLKEL